MIPVGYARDDFAGPGGWDQGLAELGLALPLIGVETDAAACETARAAGHDRFHGDVRDDEGLLRYLAEAWDVDPLALVLLLYLASPPCQTFSAAGNGSGRKHLARLLVAVQRVADGMSPTDAVASVDDEELDERSVLVLEPLRVIRDHRPRVVMLEQVKEVLPVWGAYVDALRGLGYSAWCGVLNAEQYGVPQTRRRAVLVAVRDDVMDEHCLAEVPWPAPTHSRFHVRDRERLDEGVLPWVSMAEALGWADGTADRVLRSNYGTGGDPSARGERLSSEPAPTVTSKVDRNKWQGTKLRSSAMANAAVRDASEPAPTITAAHDRAERVWLRSRQSVAGEGRAIRDQAEPAVTVGTKPHEWGQAYRRTSGGYVRVDEGIPSRTVKPGNPRGASAAPRFDDVVRLPSDAEHLTTAQARELLGTSERHARVSVQEAAVLQSFPVDYPWRGAPTKQYQQVGNAIPPGLARAVAAPLLELLAPPA